MSTRREQRRAAARRYRDAVDAFDAYTAQHELAHRVGVPVPTREEDDPEYKRLSKAIWQARSQAPWWATWR